GSRSGQRHQLDQNQEEPMPAKGRIPAPLRKLTQDQAVVEVNGTTVQELLGSLEKQYPGLKERICDESGQIRRFVNIFVNGEDIRFLAHLDTPLKAGDELSIVPAIAGGR